MYDYIPKECVNTILHNLMVQKIPDTQDSALIDAYKAGFRHAIEQIHLELNSKELAAKTLKLRYIVMED